MPFENPIPAIALPATPHRLFAATRNVKQQAVLSVADGVGPHASEVTRLKVGDVDCQRMSLQKVPLLAGVGGDSDHARQACALASSTE